jgi:hypothetical protein
MPTKDGFNPEHPLPLFLADQPEQQGIGKAWDRAAISSRVLKASILLATAIAISIAILSVGNPVALLADVTASLVDKSALQPGTDQSTSTIQSTADARALPTAKDAPTRDEIAAASESAGQSQAENSEPSSEALLRQFEAWAAEKDAQAQVGPVQSVQDAPALVVQSAPAQVAEDIRASLKLKQKPRHLRALHNARAEMRPGHNPGKKVRREQNSRVQDRPAQEAPAPQQGEFVQNAEPPSLLQTFGWRN